MPQTITTGFRALLDAAAEREIETLSVEEAAKLHGRDDVTFRRHQVTWARTRARGQDAGRSSARTRGMLEFWIDPASPYHKPVFAEDKTFVFFCAGGWRSALAPKLRTAWAQTRRPHQGRIFRMEEIRQAGGPAAAEGPKEKP
jgi:hypothetical protein